MAVIERAFTGGKRKVVVYRGRRGQEVKGQKDDAPSPPEGRGEGPIRVC